jgi:ATP-binding cassette subfamily B protein
MVVVQLAGSGNHFVVVWQKHGPWLQVMDPAAGRRWVRASRFLEEVYLH